MQRALSFHSSPSLAVPLRFLISAPLFTVVAALFLLLAGPQALASRWHGSTLALTHFFTLGVLVNAMAGALLQILPVATGIRVLQPRITAWWVHTLLLLGTISLAAAFLSFELTLFALAGTLLTAALLGLIVSVAGGLWRDRARATKGSPEILRAVRMTLFALGITVLFGALLAGSTTINGFPLRQYTDLHATWGLLGWVGILIVGIAYQVIPMFQVTELYPKAVTQWLTLGIFMTLLMLTANTLFPWSHRHEAHIVLATLLLAGYLIFAIATFDLLRGRKRPAPDTTTLFWLVSLGSLAACAPVWLLHSAGVNNFSVLLGVLFIVGFAWSAVNGMLYKIIPFLLWYNAQRDLTIALRVVPKVKHFIRDEIARPQFHMYWIALSLLILASVWPHFFTPAAALTMLMSNVWLCVNIGRALLLYRRASRAISRELRTLSSSPMA